MPISTRRSSRSRVPDTTRGRAVRKNDSPASLFVDTSAWIAFFSASDGRHADADVGFRKAYAAGARLITTPLVLAETHRLLLFRAGIRPARLALDRILGIGRLGVIYPVEEHDAAARTWLDALSDRSVSYTDAMSFAVMESLRCYTAFSFDEDFVAAGFTLWSARA